MILWCIQSGLFFAKLDLVTPESVRLLKVDCESEKDNFGKTRLQIQAITRELRVQFYAVTPQE